jgi:CrcB protein
VADPVVLSGVVAAGAVGAGARMALTRVVDRRHRSAFPWSILAVNVAGSFVLGLLVGAAGAGALPASTVAIAGAGACGGFTTFSAFAVDTVALGRARRVGLVVAQVLGSVVLAVVAARLGRVLGG